MKLLEIQSSVRQQNSISRQLAEEFIQKWRSRYPKLEHLVRDCITMNFQKPTGQ